MDRPSTSTNPLFDEQDAPNDYVTKAHLFGVQRTLHQGSEALGKRIEQLATDFRQTLDDKLSSQMEEFHTMMVNCASSTSSTS
jgi:hypothetical protein